MIWPESQIGPCAPAPGQYFGYYFVYLTGGRVNWLSGLKLQRLIQQIQDILSSIESNTGIKWSLKKGSSCPAVKNNKALFEHYCSILSTQFPFINTKMVLAAEDFGYFSDKFPSFMFWLGTREMNQKAFGLHHNDFHPSNNVIPIGIKAFQTILNS